MAEKVATCTTNLRIWKSKASRYEFERLSDSAVRLCEYILDGFQAGAGLSKAGFCVSFLKREARGEVLKEDSGGR
jgi:hypothetical protein